MTNRIDTLRVPPHSNDAEENVLGALLLAPAGLAKVSDFLTAEDFYNHAHRVIFRTICELSGSGQPIDTVTMMERIEADGMAEQIGGSAHLSQLANATASAANIVAYAEIVVEHARLRRAIEVGTNIAGAAFERGAQSEAVIAEGVRKLSGLQISRLRGGLQSARSLTGNWIAALSETYSRGESITGLPTPWAELNRKTHGLQKGDLIIIAARSNMGKTVMAAQLAEHAALVLGIRTAFFSLEMSANQLLARMVALRENIPHDWLMSPVGGNETYWPRVTDATVRLNSASLLIDETPSLTAQQIQARARRAHMQAPIGLIVVDHLHEILLPGRTSADRAHDLGVASQTLKSLGKEFGCPVVALAQLNRELLNRSDKRPIMSDLRASGDIEQIADLILFLHRDDYYDKKTHLKDVVEVEIGKGRNIRTGERINLHNRFDVMRLDDWVGELPLAPVKPASNEGFRTRRSPDRVSEAYS